MCNDVYVEKKMTKPLLDMASRSSDPNYQQISGHVLKDLVIDFKTKCLRKHISHSEALEQAIELWVNRDSENKSKAAN